MTYASIAALTQDNDFTLRIAACYSAETASIYPHEQPQTWAENHRWEMASAPGFGDAYAYAQAGGVVRPGNDPAVITDAQILAAVQAIITNETSQAS